LFSKRFGTDEEKKKSDQKKLKFCQPEGDYITALHVFQLWSQQATERQKAAFCSRESLNNKVLKTARQTFQEVQRVVAELKKRKITFGFQPDGDRGRVKKTLVRLIAECFSENICVYSGWDAGGYVAIQRGAQVFVHPGSALCYYGKLCPRYLVFETVLTTSNDWALNPTPVSKDLLQELQPTGLFAPVE
jgi:ATP-dependent RNA helicase DHX8/PRP22